jgi:hypothetical protein
MRHQLTVIRFFLLLCSFSFVQASLATNRDSLLHEKNKVSPMPWHGKFDKNFTLETTKKFEGLDRYLEQQVFSVKDNGAVFTQAFFDEFNGPTADSTIAALRAGAENATKEVESANNYVDYLQPTDIYRLPVGFKKNIGTGSYITIAVSSAIFKPAYAELTVFARVKIPQLDKPIFFGMQGLKLSYNGGIIGNARLVLLGDVAIPINGNSTALILKGSGFNTSTGTAVADDKTYVSLDCKGFREIGLTADLQFSRNMIIPVNTAGNPLPTGKVTASFTHLVVSNWNDISATVSFDNPFQVKGLNGFVFTVNTAAFDFSDIRNNPDIVYPPGYQDKYLQADNLNTWRGVYVKQLSVALPKAFKNREDSTKLVSFGVNDLIIDNNGLTGVFFANNVLPITKGNAAGWKFSVDSIRLALEASRLVRAGFGGRLGLPVNKTNANSADTVNKRKFLEYSASISISGDYVCRVVTKDSLDFDVFAARVLLAPNSYVQLKGNSDRFEAEAMLTGKIGISSNIMKKGDDGGGRTPIADMKGIDFQELHLTSYPPYFTAKYFGYKGEVKFGNFPISFEDIHLVKPTPNEVGIAFLVKLNLGDEKGESSSFSGKAGLQVIGEINNESGGILNWQFSKIKIDSVIIKADIKGAFKLDGWVKFFDDTNPASRRYGRGFEGGITAEFKSLSKISVRALFAKAPTFRYWYVDAAIDLGTGIPAGPISLKGFAGGAYYGMTKESFGQSLPGDGTTGINYKADSTAGLGVKAGIAFSISGTKAVSGQVSFEIAFNKGGGLRYIGFFGMVKISGDLIPTGSGVGAYLTKQLKKVADLEKSASTLDLIKMTDLKETNPTEAAALQKKLSEQMADPGDKDPPNSKPGESGLSAYIGIQYDFNKKSLHATFDLYINAAGGLLTGAGSGNRAGWSVFHSEPGKWYLRAGTPTDPIGIKFGIGSFFIKTTSYLMLGHDMPAFPPPPAQVISILQQSGLKYESNIGKDAIAGGRGIAFGAGVQLQTGDLRFLFFYANFSAGLGFDVMLKDYGDAHCEGRSGPIGINGWYAQGQAYVYLQGELGINIKLLFIKKKIAIIKGGAAALMQARLPNPTWVGGALGMNISILGGLINGHFNFKFSFGTDCKIVAPEPFNEEDIKIVEEIKPEATNANDVSVLISPTVKFRVKPGQILEIPKDDGGGTDYFQPNLDYIKIYKTNGNIEIPGKITFNTTGDLATLLPNAVLDPLTDYKLVVKVSFQKSLNGRWVTFTQNGQPVEEIKELTFKTGNAPVELELTEISNLYPFVDQRNYYKDEPNKGIVKLRRIFPQAFFTNFQRWKIRVETLNGTLVNTNYATTDNSTYFNYLMPTNLQTNTTYNFVLQGEGVTNPALDTTKPTLKFKFTTSNYPTFANKINALQMVQPVVGRVASDAIDLQAVVSNYEGFELYELVGNKYTDNKPMIQAEADVTDELYYNQLIKPLIYVQYPLKDSLSNVSYYITGQGLTEYGVAPLAAITPSWYYINSLTTGTYNNLLKTRMAFVHNTNKYFNLHFLDYRKQLINYYLSAGTGPNGIGGLPTNLPVNIRDIITHGFPFMLKGQYKAKLTFVQLDNTRGTTGEFIYENPIE